MIATNFTETASGQTISKKFSTELSNCQFPPLNLDAFSQNSREAKDVDWAGEMGAGGETLMFSNQTHPHPPTPPKKEEKLEEKSRQNDQTLQDKPHVGRVPESYVRRKSGFSNQAMY